MESNEPTTGINNNIQKINIDSRYFTHEEIRTNTAPYVEYLQVLQGVFDFNSNIKSFCDVGCANGPLLKEIQEQHPTTDLFGIEYFDWQKEAAHTNVQDLILIHDLRDPIPSQYVKKYDIVNCTETGEHIDPAYAHVFLENLRNMCGKYLIVSWANSGGVNDQEHDQHLQHLNPLPPHAVQALIESHGFKKDEQLTNDLVNISFGKNSFYFWWRQSLSVYRITEDKTELSDAGHI